MRVGIIGCGLIGKRRAHVVHESPSDELVIVADIVESRAKSLAAEMACLAATDWREVVARDNLDAVIVSTSNKFLMPITVAGLERGKHILCEKPLGRNLDEAKKMVDAACKMGLVLKTGFNHRHHPAIWKAHELCHQGSIGPLMFIRAVYGHGGRPGYDHEWRADGDLAGGGELLDQGVHILDLCRWFMGGFTEAFGFTSTYYWNLGYFPPYKNPQASAINHQPSTAPHQLEDNAFVLLRTADGRIAQFHTSWTQWKNHFSFEVFGREGYIRAQGIGGSYGMERLEVGKRKPGGGPPEEQISEFPGSDLSWRAEWQEFASAIREGRQPLANGEDGLKAMELIDAIYRSFRKGCVVHLDDSEKSRVSPKGQK